VFYRARPPGPWPAHGAREVEAPRGIGAAEVEREQSCARVAAAASLKARLEATRALAELVGAGGEKKISVSDCGRICDMVRRWPQPPDQGSAAGRLSEMTRELMRLSPPAAAELPPAYVHAFSFLLHCSTGRRRKQQPAGGAEGERAACATYIVTRSMSVHCHGGIKYQYET